MKHRAGNNFAGVFPLIAAAIATMPGALVRDRRRSGRVCDSNGLAVFDLILGHGSKSSAVLCAFDLLEVNCEDIRGDPVEERKSRLAGLLRFPRDGIALNEHYREDGAIIYTHACALGCEGIVSKRLGSPYRAGRVADWIKTKNPAASAVKREAWED